MKTLEEIMEMIALPEEVRAELAEIEAKLLDEKNEKQGTEIRRLTALLAEEAQWETAREHLKELLAPDERGFKMLCCMLRAAAYSYERYRENGIPDRVFIDTMKCFTRFVREYKDSFGCYGFDRDFWAGRQLSLLLFRLGELEFEKYEKNGDRYVSIHIPSDVVLTRENCMGSFEQARAFFANVDSRYADTDYICSSWLLSPALKELLPEDSKIIKFQEMFEVTQVDKEDRGFLAWVFKRSDVPVEELPEDTSLQRKMKKHLLAGGWIGEAEGVLRMKF